MLQDGAHVVTRLPTTCGPKFPARAPPFPASFRTCSVHVSVHVSQRRWTQPLARRPITDAPSAPSFLTRSKVVLAFCGLKSSLFLNLVSCYSKILAFRNRDGHRRRRLRVLLIAEDSPAHQEEAAVPDGGDEGENRLRRLREEGEEGPRGHERCELSGGDGEAEQGDGDGVRGRGQGDASRGVQDGEAGGAVAVRALRDGGAPIRAGRLRQAGAGRVRAQRRGRPLRRAARPRLLHRGQVHRRLQRREPQRLLRHVVLSVMQEGDFSVPLLVAS